MDYAQVESGNYTSDIPSQYDWESLRNVRDNMLIEHYQDILHNLGHTDGLISIIFCNAQNRIQDPAKLRHLITLIDDEIWTGLDMDVKGEIYEGLLEKNAQDVKSGAGQYFTLRPLIQAMVEALVPEPGMTICDPAAGTGGFLIAAHDYISHNYDLSPQQQDFLNHAALSGWEIVENTARLCLMNLYLHGVSMGKERSPIHVDDALAEPPTTQFDIVLTNPPFGRKGSVTYIADENEMRREARTVIRQNFWATTSNKQLNFLQHAYSILKTNGRAAIVVPDNVLFEGGAGETIRRNLLHECDCHTLLRLPTGIFYAQGVKANVLFFDKKEPGEKPSTQELWIYDLRTNMHFTRKQHPLTYVDLEDFVTCYNPNDRHKRTATWSEQNPDGRWRHFTYEELMARDKVNLDIFWIRDESLVETANLPDLEVIAVDIIEDLESAIEQFRAIV